MRFLGIGQTNDLAAMYGGLQSRGHDVRVVVEDPACHDVFEGILQRVEDWEGELGWIKAAGEDGIILFESATHGALQDALRSEGFQVIGGSGLGDRLEADRAFGQSALQAAGLQVARCHRFAGYDEALAFLDRYPARYVLKFNGASSERSRNYVGQSSDGADVRAMLSMHAGRPNEDRSMAPDFILMEFVHGIEIGVGGYFNGHDFLSPVCVDFEHKRFFPGDLGELTGEMGTIVSYQGSARLYATVLRPLVSILREGGYCGYINVNLIANESGLWPLEFTCRFGYPGFAICEALHTEPWENIFRRMLRRDVLDFGAKDGFACGVVLTVPPFPYRHGYADLSKGLPIFVDPNMTQAQRESLHFSEVALRQGQLVASGSCGYLGVVTGVGTTVQAANLAALDSVRKVLVPNLRYRTDIGARLSGGELQQLHSWGWLPGKDSAA
ncbi:phosphoribosylamine--glycine ligase [Acidovorax sp. NCPPB 3576]|uniref:phosphoribosylamine--glycine ligase n=1 Tax=Acidovorax sp. NCPPB 3576 TaxID=2940488 RepID=UPI0023497BA2|nr:phosphoribosylamine--glycine ligase [Acidovorax sp. NCPPB 3576]WCM86346.1 phosphoribosylamine--glycine ligase [Acidovorax sp. NCPPB 3576]